MNSELISFLKDYWAQLTLLIGAIGYCVKSILDLFIKRFEIKFSNLHENRLGQIKIFYKSYLDLERKLAEYYSKTMFSKLEDGARHVLRLELADCWRTFVYELKLTRLYVRSRDLELLDEIEKSLDEANKTIDMHWIDIEFGTRDKESSKKMEEIRIDLFPKKLPELLKRFENSLRKTYR